MGRFVIALALLWSAQVVLASDTPQASDAPGTLNFNISPGGYPPYTIAYPDGTVSGIFWDVLSVITQRLDLELHPVRVPPKRSDHLLEEGYSDVTIRAIEWAQQPDKFVFSEPVMMTRDAIFVHRSHPGTIKQVGDLRGTLLSRLGFSYPWLENHPDRDAVTLVPLQNQRSLFKRLYQGGDRFVGAISNVDAGYWVLRNEPLWDNVIEEAPIRLDEVGLRLMLPPRHANLVPQIDRELSRLKESGELDRIIKAYR